MEIITHLGNEVMFEMFSYFAEENAVDEELVKPVDIGFPSLRPTRSEQIAIQSKHMKQQKISDNLEKISRTHQCKFIIAVHELNGSYTYAILFTQWT